MSMFPTIDRRKDASELRSIVQDTIDDPTTLPALQGVLSRMGNALSGHILPMVHSAYDEAARQLGGNRAAREQLDECMDKIQSVRGRVMAGLKLAEIQKNPASPAAFKTILEELGDAMVSADADERMNAHEEARKRASKALTEMMDRKFAADDLASLKALTDDPIKRPPAYKTAASIAFGTHAPKSAPSGQHKTVVTRPIHTINTPS